MLGMANGQPAGWIWMASEWLDGSQPCGRSQDCGAQANAAACSQALAMPQGSQAAADTLSKERLGKGLAGWDSEGLGWWMYWAAYIAKNSCGWSGVQSFEERFCCRLPCRGLFLGCCGKGVLGQRSVVVCSWQKWLMGGCRVILKGKELGESCAKLCVKSGDSISASSVYVSVLG